jgi:hypothetical protein
MAFTGQWMRQRNAVRAWISQEDRGWIDDRSAVFSNDMPWPLWLMGEKPVGQIYVVLHEGTASERRRVDKIRNIFPEALVNVFDESDR